MSLGLLSQRRPHLRKLVIHSFLPLILGGAIYLFIRPSNFLMHDVIENIHFSETVDFIKQAAIPFSSSLPSVAVFNLPAGLWVYSFTSAILFIWNFRISKRSILFCITPVLLGLGSEIGQAFGFIPGTFDPLDATFYLLGTILPFLILTKTK